ncbi:MAG TPA: serine hydrolase domain-containing protein [Anaerolineales bacterium]|nr:serine hydrolase domain-containing protein [Anaerolineales bacterium]
MAELNRTIESYLQQEVVSGFSGAVLVWHEGGMLINGVYGSLKGQEVSRSHRFCLASLGKQFTSAAVLKCVQRGLLTLDSSIADFISDVPPEKHPITVLNLLAHTSGWLQSYAGETHPDRDSAIAAILAQPLASKPGSVFHYSNDNYQLAAGLIEIVSGITYQEFAITELFTTAGLENTGQLDAKSVLQLAPALEPFPTRFSNPSWGQQGYYSTTQDLYRWYTALRSEEVLQKEWVDKMFAPVVPIREGASALGWFIGATETGVKRIFSRGNEDFGANSLFYAYPEHDTIIIVLTHTGNKDEEISYSRAIHHWIEKRII